jgi:hypothetical protein
MRMKLGIPVLTVGEPISRGTVEKVRRGARRDRDRRKLAKSLKAEK